jgi:ribose transport system substrate-binding protein
MKKIWMSLLAICLIVIPLSACATKQTEEKEKPKVVVVLKTVSSPYWKFVQAGAQKAFKDLNVDGKVIGPASESQVIEEVNMMEDELNQNPDALVVAPTQPPTAIPVFKRYKAQNIPVLLIDTDADWADKTTYIGTDNITAGKQGGEYLASLLKKGDKVALISGALGNPATDSRIQGAKKALEAKGLIVVANQPADSDKSKALTVMENILQTHPDVKGVFAANDDMALGAIKGAKDKGADVKIIGTDGNIDAIESILAGGLAGTVAQNPFEMGYQGVQNAVNAINGKKVPKRIDSGAEVITKENGKAKLEFLKNILK